MKALTRLFFGRLFETEVFSSSVAAASSLIWILAFLATPGVMFSFVLSLHYSNLSASLVDGSMLGHQALLVDFAMAAAAIASMLVWNSLTPDRRDVMVLGALPVTAGQQARARLLALVIFVALFIAAVAGPTSIAFNIFTRPITEIFVVVPNMAGHLVATALGVSFVFFAFVNLQLLLAAIVGPRGVKAATLPLQAIALLSLVASLSVIDQMVMAFQRFSPGSPIPVSLEWNPAAWFVALYRYVAGDSRQIFAELGQRALYASAINAAILVVLYPLAYGRCLRNVITAEGRRTSATSRAWATAAAWLLRPFLRSPLERGLGAFMIATIGRGHLHRFLLGLYGTIGFVLSLPFVGQLMQRPSTIELRYAWFFVSLGWVFWLATGARVAMMMPSEPVANWIFKLTEPVDKRRVMTTVVTVVASVTTLPVTLAFAAVLIYVGESRFALTLFVIVTLAGIALIELLTLTMKAVPFSCTYLPGQMKLRYYWAPYFFLWLTFVFTLGRWSVHAVDNWSRFGLIAVSLFTLCVLLRVVHMAHVKKIKGFVYEELEPALASGLALR
jgi:hypothetical protein